MKTLKALCSGAALACSLFGAALPARAETVYQVPSLSDFSGPFASIMPLFAGAREAVVKWWNIEKGAQLGIKLELKPYDTRYDTAQTASLWPGVLSTSKPIIGLSLGGPDTAALQQRLPNDKVPMILGSASNGFAWRPNQWILSTRPTFVHEIGAFVEWFQKTKVGGTRPVKIAMFTSEASPSYADMGKGVAAYAKANSKIADLVEMVYVEPQPADLTLQLRRVLSNGAELIIAPASIQQAIAIKRAMQALGKNVPIVFNAHNSLSVLEKPMGGLVPLEGDYEAHALVVTGADDSEARGFYDLLVAKHGLKAPWHTFTGMGIGQTLVLVRAVEAAAIKHGSNKLTGELVYKTLVDTHFPAKSFYGFSGGDIDFSVEAPFPLRDPRINVGQVVGGKIRTVASAVPVPQLAKW
ncbi:MAG: ABC transporter substrate-binding protein [Rhodocyclales bacterium]|nr:ABC transporter substrate-binding protein [Rhodocyclales bacterium]